MLEVVTIDDKIKWNDILSKFNEIDVYYTYEYNYALYLHGDGKPHLFYFYNDKCKIIYITFVNDISTNKNFQLVLPKGKYFDMESPYGYGGPYSDIQPDDLSIEQFWSNITNYCNNNCIVSQFIRVHPLLSKPYFYKNSEKYSCIKDTIFIDTTDTEKIWTNIISKNRNMIRKAEKNNVSIFFEKDGKHLEQFLSFYNQTMDKHNASEYYYFDKNYFEYLLSEYSNNVFFGYAKYEDKVIAGSMFLYNKNYIHYHLSGSLLEYRKLAATNLLLYKTALLAQEMKIKTFHLGGGVAKDDSLFSFKKSFNKNGSIPFYIAGDIFNKEAFQELVNIRKIQDENFDENNSLFIKYRR